MNRRATDKIACPFCGFLKSTVRPSHPRRDEQQTGGFWRLRQCDGCGQRFKTEEVVREFTSTSTKNPSVRNI
jgi:transcriptional regulator NrdR family protein